MACLAQMIIAAAIGERLGLELQHVGHGQPVGLRGREQSAHFVQHHGRGDDIALEHQLTGDLEWFEANLACHQQQFDEGAVPLGLLEDAVANLLNGDR